MRTRYLIFAVMLASVGDRGYADDPVQGALERSLRYAMRFRRGTNPHRWQMTITHSGNQITCLEVRDLDWVFQMLWERQREVVLMVGLDDMSYAEISLVLGMPVGTVMSRLSRGRERFSDLTARVRPESKLGVTST
ncbi:RNA polymerase sigma factor [Paraburkholderia xenovorans]|uniref:RNA polymerase sigma factor n=1 Tax=Paraburkholderia xenovorans TaxID=36873 RepID=UPI0038B7ACAB